jgi:hypothetical protein
LHGFVFALRQCRSGVVWYSFDQLRVFDVKDAISDANYSVLCVTSADFCQLGASNCQAAPIFVVLSRYQVAGWLISQNQHWIVDERAGDAMRCCSPPDNLSG